MGELLYAVFPIMCGVVCYVLAKQKGRTGWWFLAGLLLNILGVLFVAVASDVTREELLDREITDLRRELAESAFFQSVTTGEADDKRLCLGCARFRPPYSICAAFGRVVSESVVDCQRFAPGEEARVGTSEDR